MNQNILEAFVKFINETKLYLKLNNYKLALFLSYFFQYNIFDQKSMLPKPLIEECYNLFLQMISQEGLFDEKNIKIINIIQKITIYLYLINANGLKENQSFTNFYAKVSKVKVIKDASTDSHWERNFEKTLNQEKIIFEKQKIIGPFTIDYFIRPNICVNVDGPSHFIGDSKLYKSKDLFRQKILELMNYKAISIPFFKYKRGIQHELENRNFVKSLMKF